MAEKVPVRTSARDSAPAATPPANRKVGLDKPCNMCGKAIYFNYQGPLDGVCGNCTDQLRHRLAPRGRSGGSVAQKTRTGGFGWGAVLLAFLAGAAAAAIVLLSDVLPL